MILHLEVFIFIMSIFVVIAGILHTVAIFKLKNGKLVTSEVKLAIFAASLSYIITMLICGF